MVPLFIVNDVNFVGKIFQEVIISHISFLVKICTQIWDNEWGGVNSYVFISSPHKSCDQFWFCPVFGYFLTWLRINWWWIDLLPPK